MCERQVVHRRRSANEVCEAASGHLPAVCTSMAANVRSGCQPTCGFHPVWTIEFPHSCLLTLRQFLAVASVNIGRRHGGNLTRYKPLGMRCKMMDVRRLIQVFQPKFTTITLTTPATPPIVLWKLLGAAGYSTYVTLDFRMHPAPMLPVTTCYWPSDRRWRRQQMKSGRR
jgi:hypothetical protein